MKTKDEITGAIHSLNSEDIAQAIVDGLEDRMSIAMNSGAITVEDEKIITLYNAATEVLYEIDQIEPKEYVELILEEIDGHSD